MNTKDYQNGLKADRVSEVIEGKPWHDCVEIDDAQCFSCVLVKQDVVQLGAQRKKLHPAADEPRHLQESAAAHGKYCQCHRAPAVFAG